MNLVTEYQKRHKSCFIPLCHDGICFFNLEEKCSLIALTSLSCKSFITCQECDTKKTNVIVELFIPNESNNCHYSQINHIHVDPSSDLLTLIKNVTRREYAPYYASSYRDLELWLWKFCIHKNKFRLKSKESDPQLKLVEQIVYCIQKNPKVYKLYYSAYQTLLLQRKYIIFDTK